MSFVYFNPNPAGKRVGDCVIRALCKLLGQEWDKVYAGVATEGFRQKDMPSSDNVWIAYLKRQGYRMRPLPDTCPDCYTVKDFCGEHCHGSFLLQTGSHVIAVADGDYYDSWDSGDEVPIYYFERCDVNGG